MFPDSNYEALNDLITVPGAQPVLPVALSTFMREMFSMMCGSGSSFGEATGILPHLKKHAPRQTGASCAASPPTSSNAPISLTASGPHAQIRSPLENPQALGLTVPCQKGRGLSSGTLFDVKRQMHDDELEAGRIASLEPMNKRPVVPHGLRSTFWQWTTKRSFPCDMVGRRHEMMEVWASFLSAQTVAEGNVIAMGRRDE